MTVYTFKYQNSKGGLYFLLALFGVPFGTVFLSLFLLAYISWIFWISIPLMIGLSIYCFRLFFKKSKGMDTITVHDEGFTSKDYGRVSYRDIHSIPPYGALQAPPPSMRIKLHNGKKLVWQLNAESPKSTADVAAFTAFREALLEHLKQPAKCPVPETPLPASGETEVIENDIPKEPEYAPSAPVDVIEQLERHKNRDFKYKYLTIPFGLALAVMMFVRTCGEDMIREYKQKDFEGVRNTILGMETDYEDNLQKARNMANTYSLGFGPVLLFTNDPQAKLAFIPDIRQGDAFVPDIQVVGLRRVADNKKLVQFMEHPDRVHYKLVAFNSAMKFSAIMDKSVFAEEDSAAVVIYFAVYHPKASFPSRFTSPSDTVFHPIQYTSSINIPKAGKLTRPVIQHMDFAAVRAILQKYEGSYLYMAAKTRDGISAERYEVLTTLVKSDLEEHGIAVDNFQSKYFNVE